MEKKISLLTIYKENILSLMITYKHKYYKVIIINQLLHNNIKLNK